MATTKYCSRKLYCQSRKIHRFLVVIFVDNRIIDVEIHFTDRQGSQKSFFMCLRKI